MRTEFAVGLPPALHQEMAPLFGAGWLTDPGERLAYAYDN